MSNCDRPVYGFVSQPIVIASSGRISPCTVTLNTTCFIAHIPFFREWNRIETS